MIMNKPLIFGLIGAAIVLAVLVGVLFVLPLVTRTPPLAPTPAFGQQQQQEQQIITVTPPNDTRVLEQSEIKNRVSIGLIRGELTDYKLYADGRGEFIFQIGTSNRTMNVTINQPWGAAEGYIYNSTGVYTPDGSQRLIIATD